MAAAAVDNIVMGKVSPVSEVHNISIRFEH